MKNEWDELKDGIVVSGRSTGSALERAQIAYLEAQTAALKTATSKTSLTPAPLGKAIQEDDSIPVYKLD